MPCRKRTQPHGAAQVAALGPDLAPARRIPFGDEADDRFGRRAELGGRGLVDSGTARAFDAGHLHSKANAEERHLLLAGEADAGDLAFRPASANDAGQEDAVTRPKLLGADSALFETSGVQPYDITH